MLGKINSLFRKIGIPLNIINILVGLLMGIAYVYIPFTSIVGLVLGIFMAISGSATIGISYFFTSKNSQRPTEQNKEPPSLKHTHASNVFLAFAIPMILLNSAASFFGMYTGILLLAGALAIPYAPAAIITVAVVLACVLAAGTLINSWLQTHNIWESLKKPVPKLTRSASAPSILQPIHSPKPLQTTCTLKNTHAPKVTIPQQVSQFIGSLFRLNHRNSKDSPTKDQKSNDTINTPKHCI